MEQDRNKALFENWVSKERHAGIGLRAFTGWTGGCPRACRIYNPLLDAVINRQQLMFKVCRWESPTVSLCRQERVGSRVDYPYQDNPTGSHTHTHTVHRLIFHASTQIWSQPWRKLCTDKRYCNVVLFWCSCAINILNIKTYWEKKERKRDYNFLKMSWPPGHSLIGHDNKATNLKWWAGLS